MDVAGSDRQNLEECCDVSWASKHWGEEEILFNPCILRQIGERRLVTRADLREVIARADSPRAVALFDRDNKAVVDAALIDVVPEKMVSISADYLAD